MALQSVLATVSSGVSINAESRLLVTGLSLCPQASLAIGHRLACGSCSLLAVQQHIQAHKELRTAQRPVECETHYQTYLVLPKFCWLDPTPHLKDKSPTNALRTFSGVLFFN
jgi:hypothetical protein